MVAATAAIASFFSATLDSKFACYVFQRILVREHRLHDVAGDVLGLVQNGIPDEDDGLGLLHVVLAKVSEVLAYSAARLDNPTKRVTSYR